MTSRRSTKRSAWWRRALKSLSLPALGMGVMLFAGSIAVSTAGRGSLRSDLPPLPASALVYPASVSRPVAVSATARVGKTAPAQAAAAAADSSEQTWIVQVAAFASQARSTTTVQHLTDQGLPAYQVDPDDTTSGLTIVRVGPFRTAREADDVRDLLREMPDYEGAFVRNITTP
jgi:cell division septation protein DedD